MAVVVTFRGWAQILNVGSIEKVNIPENRDNVVAAISPQGDYLLLTSSANKGLTKFDLHSQQSTPVTDAEGAGFDVMISDDGNSIVYRETSFTATHRRMSALKGKNLLTGDGRTLVMPSRKLDGNALLMARNTIMSASPKIAGTHDAGASRPILWINNRQLMLTHGESTRVFSPNGTHLSYLWAQVSPDGSKVVYFVAGNGTWICNIDGSKPRRLGILRAPQWVNDHVIVGMLDYDDGEFIYASKIIASDLDGNHQVLTGDDIVAMYPHVDASGSKIAFSTPAGEAYIININK